MTKAIQPTQYLYTSADFVQALKRADKVERAVSLVEGGNAVVNFPRYVQEYTALVERAVATNDIGHNINPNMNTALYKLSQKLQKLEKRITLASVRNGITPPSKELMQMLKVDEPLLEKKPSKWTWTRIAKYTAAGAAAVLAAPQIWSFLKKTPDIATTVLNAAPSAVVKTAKAAADAVTITHNIAEGLGNTLNTVRVGVGLTPDEKPDALGASTLMQMAGAQAAWQWLGARSAAGLILDPVSKKAVSVIDVGISAAVLCNAVTPNCTETIVETSKGTYNWVKDVWEEHPVAAPLIAAGGALGTTYYRDAIGAYLTGASTYGSPLLGYTTVALLLAKSANEVSPGLIGTDNALRAVEWVQETGIPQTKTLAIDAVKWVQETGVPKTKTLAIAAGDFVSGHAIAAGNFVSGHKVAISGTTATTLGLAFRFREPITTALTEVGTALTAVGTALETARGRVAVRCAAVRAYCVARLPAALAHSAITTIAIPAAQAIASEVSDSWNNGLLGEHPWITTASTVATVVVGVGKVALGGTLLVGGGVGLTVGAGVVAAGAGINAIVASYNGLKTTISNNPWTSGIASTNGVIGSALVSTTGRFASLTERANRFGQKMRPGGVPYARALKAANGLRYQRVATVALLVATAAVVAGVSIFAIGAGAAGLAIGYNSCTISNGNCKAAGAWVGRQFSTI